MSQIKLIRKPQVLELTGLSKSTLHIRINNQLFCPPISLGKRAVGFISHEVEAVLQAMIAEKSPEQIKVLVASLIAQREQETIKETVDITKFFTLRFYWPMLVVSTYINDIGYYFQVFAP